MTESKLPESVSVAEQSAAAGKRVQDIRQGQDDIDNLRTLVMRFCAEQGPSTAALATAKTNFDQAIFWLRTHRNSRAV